MTKAPAKTAAENIKKLAEKDAEPNNESARTNEILAHRADASTDDPVKASIELNDPSKSRHAYTSHKSGFVEGLESNEKPAEEPKKTGGQSHAVNKSAR